MPSVRNGVKLSFGQCCTACPKTDEFGRLREFIFAPADTMVRARGHHDETKPESCL